MRRRNSPRTTFRPSKQVHTCSFPCPCQHYDTTYLCPKIYSANSSHSTKNRKGNDYAAVPTHSHNLFKDSRGIARRRHISGFKFSMTVAVLVITFIAQCSGMEAPDDGFFKREHSLVKPYSPAGTNIPFFDIVGDTMVTNNFVRITPDDKSRSGGIWNKVPVFQRAWEVHLTFKVHGHSRNLAADGMAFWYVKTPKVIGGVFGGEDKFNGLGVFIDTYKNGQGSGAFPQISAILNDGTVEYDHDSDGQDQNIGSCYSMIRNREHDTHMSIRYQKRQLKVSIDTDGHGTWRECFVKSGVRLPGGYYFGVTAATGDLTDNHDVLAVRTYQLETEEPAPEGWKELVPGIDGEDIAHPTDDGYRNSATSSNKMVWTLFLLAIAICGIVGFVVFQKKQERSRHRFY